MLCGGCCMNAMFRGYIFAPARLRKTGSLSGATTMPIIGERQS
jgi:hypothetical protein